MDFGEKLFESRSKSFLFSKNMWSSRSWDLHLTDWMESLRKENELLKKNSDFEISRALTISTEFIFAVCAKLELTSHTKYIACDIYARFYKDHIRSVCELMLKKQKDVHEYQEQIPDLVERVGSQGPLRQLTCIKIAAKLTSSFVIPASKLEEILSSIGHQYSATSLAKSEIRVLEQIKYRCSSSSSPIVYVGLFLTLITMKEPPMCPDLITTLSLEDLYNLSMRTLDIVWLMRDTIYSKVFWKITGMNTTEEHKEKLAQVKSDRILEACGVITTSAHILAGDAISIAVTEALSNVTDIMQEDIILVASCMLKYGIKI